MSATVTDLRGFREGLGGEGDFELTERPPEEQAPQTSEVLPNTLSTPIFMLYLIKRKEAWYQLSDEERWEIDRQTLAATTQAAGRRSIVCDATWSSGECEFFELTEFPDMTAVQTRIELYEQVDLFRYYDISTVLGLEMGHHCHEGDEVE